MDSPGSRPKPVVGSFSTILFLAPPSRVVRELVDLPPGQRGRIQGGPGRAALATGCQCCCTGGRPLALVFGSKKYLLFPLHNSDEQEWSDIHWILFFCSKKKQWELCYTLSQLPGVLSLRQWETPGGSDGKESTCNAGPLALIPGLGISLGKGMATHSSIHAWKIPRREEPGGPKSTGSWRVRHNWTTNTLMSDQ